MSMIRILFEDNCLHRQAFFLSTIESVKDGTDAQTTNLEVRKQNNMENCVLTSILSGPRRLNAELNVVIGNDTGTC